MMGSGYPMRDFNSVAGANIGEPGDGWIPETLDETVSKCLQYCRVFPLICNLKYDTHRSKLKQFHGQRGT